MRELVRYDAMCRAIDAAYAVDEVKAIHDQARMLQAAARVAKNMDAEDRAYQIRWRAANKVGELTKKIEKAAGNQYGKSEVPTKQKILQDAGISKQDASEFERLSDVPRDQFESALVTKTVHDLIKPTSVSGDALDLVGTLRQFERVYLGRAPQEFMETMTTLMLEEVYRLAPLAAEWLSTIKGPSDGRPNFGDLRNNSPSAEVQRA
jgi:hypothetical protein